MSRNQFYSVIGLLIAVIVLLFGNNLFQQATGRSVFEIMRDRATPVVIINTTTPTLDSLGPSPTVIMIAPSPSPVLPEEQPVVPTTDPYSGWVICWHGRDSYEYLIAYPEQMLRNGLSLNILLSNAQGNQLELTNDSLKMCFANGEWYGHPDPNPWFPAVSYAQLLDGQITVCSDSPGCGGQQWAMLPEGSITSNAPPLQAPSGTGVHAISYLPSR